MSCRLLVRLRLPLRLQTRCFAAKEPDWARLATRTSTAEQEAVLKSVRSELVKLQGLVRDAEKPAPDINWDKWRKTILEAGLVDTFQKSFEKIQFKEPPSDHRQQLAADKKGTLEDVKKMTDEIQAAVKKLEQEKVVVEERKKALATAGLEQELVKNPELNKKYEEDIKNDKWF